MDGLVSAFSLNFVVVDSQCSGAEIVNRNPLFDTEYDEVCGNP
jgi:hypothetical protein